VRRILRRFGPIGYLVNIAGHDGLGALETLSNDEWTGMFEVAEHGAFYL